MITRLMDTCMCIFLIRAKHPAIREKFARFEVGELAISSITESERKRSTQPHYPPAAVSA